MLDLVYIVINITEQILQIELSPMVQKLSTSHEDFNYSNIIAIHWEVGDIAS